MFKKLDLDLPVPVRDCAIQLHVSFELWQVAPYIPESSSSFAVAFHHHLFVVTFRGLSAPNCEIYSFAIDATKFCFTTFFHRCSCSFPLVLLQLSFTVAVARFHLFCCSLSCRSQDGYRNFIGILQWF